MSVRENHPLFSTRLVFGLAIIALGLVLMLDRLRLWDGLQVLTWWPTVLAAFALAHLVRDGILSLGGHLWLGLAVAGFLQQFGPWGLLDRWWPAFLVWGGLLVSLRAIFPQPKRQRRPIPPVPSSLPADSWDAGAEPPQVKP